MLDVIDIQLKNLRIQAEIIEIQLELLKLKYKLK